MLKEFDESSESSVYVLAVLGESPSVLTELLWWLCVVERRCLAGIEVWATQRGERLLRELVAGRSWQDLQDQTGPLPKLQPSGAPREAAHGFRAHVFHDGANALTDVRSEVQSAAVSAQLHDRVRELRGQLPLRIGLVGSLAGGRKTVSAALQTAFSLQAGPSDRLVHVLQDERLEAWLSRTGKRNAYSLPTPEWEAESGIPLREQVVVYDVAYPRLKYLVARRLSAVLERLPWADVWPVLDANMGRHAHATLRRIGFQSWVYTISDCASGTTLFEVALGQRSGALLAAMASVPGAASAGDLVAWLDQHEVGWRAPAGKGSDPVTRGAAIRGAATGLRDDLEDVPVGLERFVPPEQGFAVHGVAVEGWTPSVPTPGEPASLRVKGR